MLRHINHFEKSWKWVGMGFVTVLFVIFAVFKWGIPITSYYIAHSLPEETLQDAGNQAQRMIVRLTEPTELSAKRQAEIVALYQKIQPAKPATILFVKGDAFKANAFAIPNNTIVLTDELIHLAKNDHEILAVLAHEQGHLHHRHSLQQAFRGMGMGVFLLVITGDSSGLLNNVPIVLAGAQYSQEFELEADLYAIQELKRLNLSPQHMADILVHLHNAHDHSDDENALQMLSTHPSTQERIQQVQQHMP